MFQRFRDQCKLEAPDVPKIPEKKVQQLRASRLVANMQTRHLQQIRKVLSMEAQRTGKLLDISLRVTGGLGTTPTGCT